MQTETPLRFFQRPLYKHILVLTFLINAFRIDAFRIGAFRINVFTYFRICLFSYSLIMEEGVG